jgi:DNA helicase-2/ATP-dependent DNA helicase PcrA
MTVHSAKGLEFKNVFVVGMEENLFPSQRQGEKQTEDALEEERRLFYVALTRAKENAWFTYANQRYRWGNLDFCSPSRFLEELDSQFLDQSGSSGFQQNNRIRNSFNTENSGRNYNRPTTAPVLKSMYQQNIFGKKLVSLRESGEQSSFTSDDPMKIQSGMVVEHQRFGEGKVLKIEGEMPNLKATIFFQSSGQKQLLLKFAKLKIK